MAAFSQIRERKYTESYILKVCIQRRRNGILDDLDEHAKDRLKVFRDCYPTSDIREDYVVYSAILDLLSGSSYNG